jgi:predicted acyltransferase
LAVPPTAAPPASRLRSIDVLRGFDMFWIIGADELVRALGRWWNLPALTDQMEHVRWEGFRFYDLIFPLFLFIVGVVLPASLAKYRDRPAAAYGRLARRTVLLVLLGWFYWGILQLDFAHFRWPGVLVRIGICYGIAGLAVLHLRARGLAILLGVILLGYWALLGLVPAPGFAAGDYSMAGNLAGYVDRMVIPGRFCCYPNGDNEGLLSTIPAVGTALLGALAGLWLWSDRPPARKAAGLFGAGLIALALGYLWWPWFPVIKNLWTSSYVLVAGGWSLMLLALFYYGIDGRRADPSHPAPIGRVAFFFLVIGVNPITIYLLKQFVPFETVSKWFLGGVMRLLPAASQPILFAGVLAAEWLVLWYLYRKGTMLRV